MLFALPFLAQDRSPALLIDEHAVQFHTGDRGQRLLFQFDNLGKSLLLDAGLLCLIDARRGLDILNHIAQALRWERRLPFLQAGVESWEPGALLFDDGDLVARSSLAQPDGDRPIMEADTV